jgi:predicted ATPase
LVGAIPAPAPAVPASLHASLMARLDRLGPAKDVAQIGAAIGREFSHALLAAVVRRPEPELEAALDHLIAAGLLFRQGEPPDANYLFNHALVQDAAYGTLLREPRRALHARIAETLAGQFAEIAERQPELLARHFTEAGLIPQAAALWGKAGQRSLERSALVEATEQIRRALAQIESLPGTPALRQAQIKLQVALANALMHVRGHAGPEARAAAERARLLIEQAQALGEPPDDPLLLFSVLYGFWVASYVGFNSEVMQNLAAQLLDLADKQGASGPRMIGHRMMGISLTCGGAVADGLTHLTRAIELYDPAEHRALATRFGQDTRVSALSYRSWAQWSLGHIDRALADAEEALRDAREIGQAATLMNSLCITGLTHILCGNYAIAGAQLEEAVALADEKGALLWKAAGMQLQGCVLILTGKAAVAVPMMASGIAAWRSTGATVFVPLSLSFLARAYAEIGKLDDAWRCIGEAVTTVEATNESWYAADIHRVAGEIALLSKPPDTAKAEANFKKALALAREQRTKAWELRAAISLARLQRDRGKRKAARDLLAKVFGGFADGSDTLDLAQAKALLNELG